MKAMSYSEKSIIAYEQEKNLMYINFMPSSSPNHKSGRCWRRRKINSERGASEFYVTQIERKTLVLILSQNNVGVETITFIKAFKLQGSSAALIVVRPVLGAIDQFLDSVSNLRDRRLARCHLVRLKEAKLTDLKCFIPRNTSLNKNVSFIFFISSNCLCILRHKSTITEVHCINHENNYNINEAIGSKRRDHVSR